MLRTTVQTDGMNGAFRRIEEHKKRRSCDELKQIALVGANTMKSLVALDMAQPKSGEWYFWKLAKPSSAPGELPAIQSAELVNSFKTETLPECGTAAFQASGKHAIWMEFGFHAQDGSFHIRPFMRTGLAKYRKEILGAMRTAMLALDK